MYRKFSEIASKLIKAERKVFTFPIKLYQKYISSHTSAKCKYYPTCSNYAVTAIERYGIIVGGLLSAWRILRCNPWSKGGMDPVPEHLIKKKNRGD